MVFQRTEELNKAYQTLERLDETKSDFINVAAHELRTPLTVMQGYTAMLSADAGVQKNPYLLDAVSGLLKGTERLYEIISSMLDVARIDSRVLELRSEITWIAPLVLRAKREFQSALEERRLTMELVGLDDLPHIKADPKLLSKVFGNVIMNAIKFTPDGGKIEISGQHIYAEELGEFIEVLVRDSGIGIDPEHQELIFEKFYQTGKVALHSSGKTTFKGGGPGLGLAIARGIVQAHNGRIWAESEGHNEDTCPGSTFHILLPVAGPEARPLVLPNI
jgi:signal transduction histidine kinase